MHICSRGRYPAFSHIPAGDAQDGMVGNGSSAVVFDGAKIRNLQSQVDVQIIGSDKQTGQRMGTEKVA